jgi:hypothetical protein
MRNSFKAVLEKNLNRNVMCCMPWKRERERWETQGWKNIIAGREVLTVLASLTCFEVSLLTKIGLVIGLGKKQMSNT